MDGNQVSGAGDSGTTGAGSRASGADNAGASDSRRASDANQADHSRADNDSRRSGDSGSKSERASASGNSGDSNSSTGKASASGASSAAANNASGSATDPNSAPSSFSSVLADTKAAAPSTTTVSSDKPAEPQSDDATDDEIGFEDLSEFLSQVLVPGANTPAPPAPGDSDATVEVDFTQDSNGDLTSEIMSALSSDARGKTALAASQDRFANALATTDSLFSADSSLLKDALASEKMIAAALDPTAAAPAPDASLDLDGANTTAFSALHAAALHSPHSTNTTLQAEVRSPMGTQAWTDEVGGHLTWMAANGRESASLTVSPDHLGPIEVRISVQDGQASVWFGAQNADTRAAIEQALPRLRDLFSAQGLSLADSGVFREAPRQQPQNFSGGGNASSGNDEVGAVTSVAKRGNGALDLYA